MSTKQKYLLGLCCLLWLVACVPPPSNVDAVDVRTTAIPPTIVPNGTDDDNDVAIESVDPEQISLFVIDGENSEISYSVDEEFFNRDVQFVTAVGVTNEIDGSISLDLSGEQPRLASGEISVDISTLQSDSGRRDRAIRDRWLESAEFPIATFKLTALENISGNYLNGDVVTFQLIGEMTIREMTNVEQFDVTAQIVDGVLTGTAVTSSPLLMTDYGFDPPDIANILVVTDGVTLTIDLTATAE